MEAIKQHLDMKKDAQVLTDAFMPESFAPRLEFLTRAGQLASSVCELYWDDSDDFSETKSNMMIELSRQM
eukprot:10588638-Alexandrium_andersonii.AAC.1